MPQSDNPSFHLRLTPALRKRIRLAAVENERSINAEISARLERSFSLDEEDRAKAVKLLTEAILVLDKARHQQP
ncbi:MAG: Arc family DNA-binding protein [Mesorhizobium sp.]|uniref:Arc family DNA-binding protein n=1 Tax=unclassified Mesorhizobium TaxID=325217 RepID=UPI000FCBB185|nr:MULTISPECIES: Arc family DNA-binding protein [unclassified Mesorhizobium]RUV69665.1 Arc family DNA-binding protein [Mesorhizobium sp. M5C.F.Cr.IN.023.01.1.1]RWI51086.1 MAG: Arc family DNA-binding protein [Mesorhizobium sp.]RWI62073.1 MAG: Arc family DNA-binding protein [Mesorhizobium sp.]RWJ13923.1 MAG: Arc family DNA-binding protein [Mesorhizobium sp.]RWJ16851.1 MAG: Arc family DNA-binding protein [Mesorhizobium sp.]